MRCSFLNLKLTRDQHTHNWHGYSCSISMWTNVVIFFSKGREFTISVGHTNGSLWCRECLVRPGPQGVKPLCIGWCAITPSPGSMRLNDARMIDGWQILFSSMLSKGHYTHEPRAVTMELWEPKRVCLKAVPRHLQKHVVWSRVLKCSDHETWSIWCHVRIHVDFVISILHSHTQLVPQA